MVMFLTHQTFNQFLWFKNYPSYTCLHIDSVLPLKQPWYSPEYNPLERQNVNKWINESYDKNIYIPHNP